MSTDTKTLSPSEMKRMLRAHRAWNRGEGQKVIAATTGACDLSILQFGAAHAHFLGAAAEVLHNKGSINRADFIRLVNASTEFAIRVSPCPSVVKSS